MDKKILIIDDEINILKSLEIILSSEGFSVSTATLFRDSQVSKSCGFLVEALPNLKEEHLSAMEKNILNMLALKIILQNSQWIGEFSKQFFSLFNLGLSIDTKTMKMWIFDRIWWEVRSGESGMF